MATNCWKTRIGRVAVLAALQIAVAVAAEPRPLQLVEQTTTSFLEAIAGKRESIAADPGQAEELVTWILMPHVEVDTVGRLMLGRHWRAASADQRKRFVDEVRGMLVRTYAIALSEYTRSSEIRYLSEHVSDDGESAMVRAQIPRAQGPRFADVVFRLYRRDGAWKLVDVSVEGVSMITTYRSTFLTRIERHGLENVIQELSQLNSRR